MNDAAPLAARVIVNRVWGAHFGTYLVGTPSDFGDRGDKPTHPELLDDLAARFIANGWSLKWLHREILLSAAYRQSSHPRAEAMEKDESNKWLWRMNPRRLDIEAYRDTLLRSAGLLDGTMYGPSGDLEASGFYRRTLYGRISRSRLNDLLRLYDFPEPDAAQSFAHRHDDAAAAVVRAEQPVHRRAGRDPGEVGGSAAGRSGADSRTVSKSVRARSAAARNRRRPDVSEPGIARAPDADDARRKRGDFLAMISRREMISRLGAGLGGAVLSDLLASPQAKRGDAPAPARHRSSREGEARHFSLHDGRSVAARHVRSEAGFGQVRRTAPDSVDLRTERKTGGLLPSPFEFKKYGRGGIDISELLPNLAQCADDLCVVKSTYSFIANHEPGRNLYFTGSIVSFRPSMGSWVTYGLGTENQNLPAFVALSPGGGSLFSGSGFLPVKYQGTLINNSDSDPDKMIRYLRNKNMNADEQRAQLDFLQSMNKSHENSFGQDAFLDGRIQSMEQAYRMQFSARMSSTSKRSRNPSAMSTAPLPTPPVVCWLGGWLRTVFGTSRSTMARASRGTITRTEQESEGALPRHGQGHGRADSGSEAPRLARRDAGGLGR